MHLLPLNLGVVADHADPKEGARWATTGVHLELSDGRFLAAATDCKQLFEVSGPVVGSADDYPTWPGLEAAPNGAAHGLIPLKVWRSFFATAKKTTPKRVGQGKEVLRAVAVKLSPNTATLGCTDTESHPTEATRLVEGRFPPHRQIWPTTKPAVVVHLDPEYVAKVVKSLASFAEETDDSAKRMVVEVIDATKPVVFRVERADGVVARALVMPLGQKDGGEAVGPEVEKPVARRKGRKAEPVTDERLARVEETRDLWVKEAERLGTELLAVKAERAQLQERVRELTEQVAELKRELAGSIRDASDQSAEKHAALEKAEALAKTVACLEQSGRQLAEDRDRLQLANADLTRRVGAGVAAPAKKGRAKKGAAAAPAELSSAEKAARFTAGEFLNNVFAFLGAAVSHYEKSAPTVSAHADEMYRRLIDGGPVTWLEIAQLLQLRDESLAWEQANVAANRVYKLRHSLGMDVTGHAGF